MHKSKMRMFENFFIKNRCEKILDIGCGENKLDLNVTGINISTPADIIASAEALPFKDKSFDGSLMHHVLEHLSHREVALSELSRVTRMAAIIEVPSKYDKSSLLDKDHKIFYTKESLKKDLDFPASINMHYCAFELNSSYLLFRILSFIGKHISAIIPSKRKYLRAYINFSSHKKHKETAYNLDDPLSHFHLACYHYIFLLMYHLEIVL